MRSGVVRLVKEYLTRRYAAADDAARAGKPKAFRKEAKVLAAAALDPRHAECQLSHNAALACMGHVASGNIPAAVEAVMLPLGGNPGGVVSDNGE